MDLHGCGGKITMRLILLSIIYACFAGFVNADEHDPNGDGEHHEHQQHHKHHKHQERHGDEEHHGDGEHHEPQ